MQAAKLAVPQLAWNLENTIFYGMGYPSTKSSWRISISVATLRRLADARAFFNVSRSVAAAVSHPNARPSAGKSGV